jgi:hypothetical protein
MSRTLLATLLGAGLIATTAGPADAQDKKEKPKALPRIAIDDPEKLKGDRDYAVQGEYVGRVGGLDKMEPAGAQVIALGDGKFEIHVFTGGLPGAGWNGKDKLDLAGELKNGRVVLSGTDGGKTIEVGAIEGDKLVIALTAALEKTERKSPTLGAKPPEGAVVLFAGPDDVSRWDKGKVVELSDGKFLAVSKTGSIRSKEKFGAFKAHVEFRLPWMSNSRGQGRANSGVYVQDRYEIQVLDSFGLKGENNECGGVYTQFKPLVNMCYPPMQWQTYDIEFTPAGFEGDKKVKPARLTVLHNGVKIHDNVELKGPTGGGQPEAPTPGPIQLQDHGDPVVYRNIWVVENK